MTAQSKSKLLRGFLLAGAAFALLYTFSPRTEHRLGNVKPAAARKAMPSLAYPRLGGGEWSLAEHKGKVVLVNFWATWCPPCRAETPGLVNLANRYRARGLEVAGISMDDDPQAVVPQFAARYRIPYPMLVRGTQASLADGIESLPTTVLIDRQGRAARSYAGAVEEAALERDIQVLLAE